MGINEFMLVRVLGESKVMAPCEPDGEVTTIDYDNKEAICRCSRRTCAVDGRNYVLEEDWDKYWALWPKP